MSLGMEVGLGPGHIVLDGDPAPTPQKGGTAPPPNFRPMLWPNDWMDEDATWYEKFNPGSIVLHGDPALPSQKGHNPQFSARVYCGQTVAHLSYC